MIMKLLPSGLLLKIIRIDFLWQFLLISLLHSRGNLRLPRSLRARIISNFAKSEFIGSEIVKIDSFKLPKLISRKIKLVGTTVWSLMACLWHNQPFSFDFWPKSSAASIVRSISSSSLFTMKVGSVAWLPIVFWFWKLKDEECQPHLEKRLEV